MNNCNFIGRLTKDPEAKTTANQKTLCNFTIAVDREHKDTNGNKITDFIPCIAWSPTAEIVFKYFHKGNLIGVNGRFESRSGEDTNGNKRTYYSISVNHIDFIQGKSESKPQAVAPEYDPRDVQEVDESIDSGNEYNDLPFPLEDA